LGPSSSILAVRDDAENLVVPVTPRPPEAIGGSLTRCQADDECEGEDEVCREGRCVIIQTGGTRIWEQWWFWTVLGVVVAGAAAGTAAFLLVPAEGVDFGSPTLAR
jgi:hypothetical protein